MGSTIGPRAYSKVREEYALRMRAGRAAQKERLHELPLMVERKLNDLRRQAVEQGYPCSVDEALDPLTDDELAFVNRFAWAA